jgi:hypothetical protein
LWGSAWDSAEAAVEEAADMRDDVRVRGAERVAMEGDEFVGGRNADWFWGAAMTVEHRGFGGIAWELILA